MTSPVVHVHHDAGGAFVAQLLVGEALHLAVDGEIDILARLARILAQLADDAAIGIDLDAAGAGLPRISLSNVFSMPRLPMR